MKKTYPLHHLMGRHTSLLHGSMKQMTAIGGLLLIGLLPLIPTYGQVTVQKPRSRTQSSKNEFDKKKDDQWTHKSGSKPNRRANSAADKVFRRIQGDDYEGPDYDRPSKLVEMSFRVAPSLTLNTAHGTGDYAGFTNNGMGVRMSVGPTLDYYFFKDRYAFSSGIWYTIVRSGYRIPGSYGSDTWNPGATMKESVYNLQYVQIPLTAKMYANNLFPDARFYIQTGGIVDIKLAEKPLNQPINRLYQVAEQTGRTRQYSRGDFALLLGTGIQYKLNNSQAVIIGMTYQRGLTNVARGSALVSKSRIVSLDLGLKF
jgi:hypothetical protein